MKTYKVGKILYDDPNYCPKCEGHNKKHTIERVDMQPAEIETKCLECGHKDFWAYGFYESLANNGE